jgi:hypothetical protein
MQSRCCLIIAWSVQQLGAHVAHLAPVDAAGGPFSEQNSTSRRGPPHGAVPHSCSYARAASLQCFDL